MQRAYHQAPPADRVRAGLWLLGIGLLARAALQPVPRVR
jgi:hypothetical protein